MLNNHFAGEDIMEIKKDEECNCVILKLSGNLIEGSNSEEFNNIVKSLSKENKNNILVDLKDVIYVNSTGLSILFRGYRTIDAAGGKFKLVNVKDKFRKLLSITKLDTLFEIEDSMKSALKSFDI
jgi:anti-anti-sigma factor